MYKQLTAKVDLTLNGNKYAIKGKPVYVVGAKDRKRSILRRVWKSFNSKGDEVINALDFVVSDELIGLYFKEWLN